MRIVIYGLSKTGTTALYFKLKNSLPSDTIGLFEPEIGGPLGRAKTRWIAARLTHRKRHLLAKVLPFRASAPNLGAFESFERKILIVRDPRDRLVSNVLYQVYNSSFLTSDHAVHSLVEMIRHKEDDPAAVSLMSIVERFETLAGRPFSLPDWIGAYGERGIRQPLAFHDARPDLYQFRYEDMIDGEFSGLEAYLGIPLEGTAAVEEQLGRVERTKRYGGWRDWFTAGDVEALRPLMKPYLDRYYPDADWRLNQHPEINPDHGSRYVMRIVNERRAATRCPPLTSL